MNTEWKYEINKRKGRLAARVALKRWDTPQSPTGRLIQSVPQPQGINPILSDAVIRALANTGD
jgi:hypothetical protein